MSATADSPRHRLGPADVPQNYRAPASRRMIIGRLVLLVVVLVLGVFYLFPRIYSLTVTPYHLDKAVVSAGKYNPALDRISDHEEVTLTAFNALDRMKVALADVQQTDATVAAELRKLTDQISTDIKPILASAGTNVNGLVSSLDTLTSRIESLQAPSDGAAVAVSRDRATLAAILDDAAATAARVHSARESADSAANDLSGKG